MVLAPINSLTTIGYLLEVFLWLWIPSLVHILTSACAKMVRNGPASLNYPAKVAAMCMGCPDYGYPPPPIPPFLVVQNLYLKIVTTDNLLLKSDDDKKCHQ